MRNRNPNSYCATCSKPIYTAPSHARINNYCSRECYGISRKKLIPCRVCGEPITSGKNKRTCSRACANIARTGMYYKTGAPTKSKVKKAEVQKRRLLEIRGPKCERCPYDKIKILQIHHKKGRKGEDSDDWDNLELLCPNCHAEITYGEVPEPGLTGSS